MKCFVAVAILFYSLSNNVFAEDLKIGYVDSNKVLEILNTKEFKTEKDLLYFANEKVKKFSYANNIDIIFQNVVWVDDEQKITDSLIDFTKNNNTSKKVNVETIPYKVGFINTEKLISLAKITKDEKSDIENINLTIKDFAKKFNMSLILQDAVFANKKIDITPHLLSFITDKNITEKSMQHIPGNAPKIGFINVSRIFNESELSKKTISNLEREFFKKKQKLFRLPFGSKEFIEEKSKLEEEVQNRVKQENNKMVSFINEEIQDIAKSEKYKLILQEVVYIDNNFDITDEIIKRIDGKKKI